MEVIGNVVLFCGFACAFLLAALTHAAFFNRRRHDPPLPPGPRGIPLLGSLLFLHADLHAYFARLARAHGPIFSLRLGSKLAVVISSPAIAREVLRDHDAVFANRDVPAAGRIIAYGGDAEIVWNPNGPTWRMLRRVCVREMLGPAGLDAVYALRRREVRASVQRIRSRAGSAVDVGVEMFLATMNAVTRTLWGSTLEDGDERSIEVGKEFRKLVAEITELLGRPNVSDFFPAVAWMDLQGIQRQMRMLLRRFDQIFEEIIEMRKRKKQDGGRGEDFLEMMLRLEKEGGDGKTPFTMTNVKALLMDMVVGGTETSSNTVEWAMAEIVRKPEILRRVQAELNSVVGRDAVVEESHISQLHYLAAVIKEVLRLHPALPLMVPHCPSATCVIGGYTVPAGARVFVNVWAIHRDPEIWQDPLEFRPERFAGGGEAGKQSWDFSGNDFRYLPFGSGRRICAGMVMAERMVAYMVATLVHSFQWQAAEGNKEAAEEDMEEKFGIVMKKARPLVLVPTPTLAREDLYS
ncbi:flavonoid 3'-monooxygenase CYP75B137-like [Curcuma longa]|uniref:flavonoid 3'-monooxygenase CYP75B137-like n=1 Tax=Curcuma longa TaxID=136217 RepID=UPI003D9DB675